ncbi:MAG: hypothetical protein IPK75_05715 [Acidobacteria bacterium]|jgi:hypothetical protein|nr:hypothetical protein [Acidobacteriota bacterium]
MRGRLFLALAAGLALAGCQTAGAPAETTVLSAEAAEADPLDVAVSVSDNPSEGLTENDWGGEVPQSKPAGDVDDGGLGDLD